ncbi:MAG: TonB-dependent receptor [Bacteroidales bacterium]|nr:TonB-dependent receptor [Bacteroidales bacterium]
MRKVKFFLTVLSLLAVSFAWAQNITVKGTVTDQNGDPIIGVYVLLQGSTSGTSTDADGKYEISAPANGTLVYSLVGMQDVVMPINNKSVINIVMQEESVVLDDVMVVAYGVVKREAKTGSVTTVSGNAISEAPVSSVDKMLAGKMAGVQITAATGQPGASSQIRVRGTSSINAGNEPLWVVDGIPVMNGDQTYFTNTGNAIATINPNDIESITVLKDAAAASVYGSRAANGVVLVTTKSGKEGKAKFSARAKMGISNLANDNDFGLMTGEELLAYQRDAIVNAGGNPDDPNGRFYRPMSLLDGGTTDWIDHFSRAGKLNEYEINASAGTARSKFYSSLTYHKNEGVFYGVDYEKITFRVNADHKLGNKLEMGVRFNGARTVANDVPMQSLYYSNPMWAGSIILPWSKPYNEDCDHNVNISENSNTNPRATAKYDEQWEKQFRINGNFYLEWKPVKNVTVKTTNAIETTFGEGRRYWHPYTSEGEATLQTSRLQYVQMTTSNTITYSNVFNDKHNVRVLAGQEAMQRDYSSFYAYSPQVDPNIPYPSTAPSDKDYASYSTNERTLLSFFGIADYSFDSKYFLQASVRYDGSSLFGKNKQWGVFYSVGASWNLHSENWLKDVEWLDLLKVRASYGVNGNDNISAYQAYGVYASSQYNGSVGMLPSSPSNDDLSWELNATVNAGVDFGFFGKLNGSIDWYNRTTTDMLLSKSVPQTTGFSSNFMNIGEMVNRGVEIQLNYDIINNKDWKWDAGLNLSFNQTEIKNLGDVTEMTYSGDSRLKHVVGEGMYTFYLKEYYGVNPVNGEALWVAEDGSLTNNYNKARYIYAGSPEPKYTGGFNTSVSWKGLSLSAFLEFKGGNKVMIIESRYCNSDGNQMSMNQYKIAGNYWKKPGDTGVNPKPVAGTASNSYAFASTRWLQDGDYVRIKDITLSYTLPSKLTKKVGVSNVKIYASALNLFTFHDVDFWDPERGVTGIGAGIYPMTKSFIGGIELSF